MFGVRLGLGVGSAVAHQFHCEVVLVITKAERRHREADPAAEILSAAVVGYSEEGLLKFICPPLFEKAVRKAAAVGEANAILSTLEVKKVEDAG